MGDFNSILHPSESEGGHIGDGWVWLSFLIVLIILMFLIIQFT